MGEIQDRRREEIKEAGEKVKEGAEIVQDDPRLKPIPKGAGGWWKRAWDTWKDLDNFFGDKPNSDGDNGDEDNDDSQSNSGDDTSGDSSLIPGPDSDGRNEIPYSDIWDDFCKMNPSATACNPNECI